MVVAWRGKGRESFELRVSRAWKMGTGDVDMDVEIPAAGSRCDMKGGWLKGLRVVIGAALVWEGETRMSRRASMVIGSQVVVDEPWGLAVAERILSELV